MSRKKLYFRMDDAEDLCRTKEAWLEIMKEDEIPELKLNEAKAERGIGMYWCMEWQDFGETSEKACGKFCEKYVPRNGKSGICKNHRPPYEATDKKIILRLK